MPNDFGPYSTIAPFFGSNMPTWVPAMDQERIAAYQTYEEIYWNHPQTFQLVARGSEQNAIYLPSARIIVDTINRYTATGLNYQVDPNVGTPEQVTNAQLAFSQLFAREKFLANFSAQKLYGIIRGDSVWHITADPLKLPGTRLSLRTVDPGAYFPVPDEDNLDRTLKIHLAEQFVDNDGKVFVRRQTYERVDPANSQSQIVSTDAVFEVKEWFLDTTRPVRIISQTLLPPQITAFPVYLIRNFVEPGNPYGSSELRGFERVMAAVNQAISDEDLALALEGLGIYTTDAGQPVDEEGNKVNWIMGPGRVLEQAGDFKRINGIGSVQPYTDHIGTMMNFLREASTASDAAVGRVDVQVAESGIALLMNLAPILARATEKDNEIKGVLAQMFFDVQRWLQAFEAVDTTATSVIPTLGDKLPFDRAGFIKELVAMMSTPVPIMSAQTARELLAARGVQFAPDEAARVAAELDGTATRAAAELGAAGGTVA